MKNTRKILVFVICLVFAFFAVSCDEGYDETVKIRMPKELEITVGNTASLNASVTGTKEPLAFSVNRSDILSVDKNGTVRGLKAGECVVTAKATGVKKECKVRVKEKNPGEISKEGLSGPGIKEIDISKLALKEGVTSADMGLNPSTRLAVYWALEGYGPNSGYFHITDTNGIGADDYIAIRFKYDADTDLNGVVGGISMSCYNGGNGKDNPYMAMYGEDGSDFSVRNAEGVPYGTKHGKDGSLADTWYYMVTIVTGFDTPDHWFTMYDGGFGLTISDVYAVSKEAVKENFPGLLPEDKPAPSFDGLYWGVDVSKHNGDLDFAKMKKAGVEFAIVRAGYGGNNIDPKFKRNIDGFLSEGVYVGAYWFSYALNTADAIKEADYFDAALRDNGYWGKLEFPVFCDFEYDSENYMKKNGVTPSKALDTAIMKAFCDRMASHGWYAANYANQDYMRNHINPDELADYDLWFAKYAYSDERANDTPPTGNHSCGNYTGKIWQYSSSGAIDGSSPRTDLNYCYFDYPSVIRSGGYNGF